MKLSTCFFNKQNQSIRTADALLRSVTASPVELGAGALDALAIGTLGEYLPVSAWYPYPRVHDIYIQLCPGDTVEARPPRVLHDMLWSRVSSCGLLALEEVVSVPDICNVLSRLFCF